MDQRDIAITTSAASDTERLIRCYPNLAKALLMQALFTLLPLLGLLSVLISDHRGFLEMGLLVFGYVILIYFGLQWLSIWLWLFNIAVLRKPIVEFNAAGISWWPLLSPWRSITIPWDEVTLIGFLYHSNKRKSQPTFLVKTQHDDRYVSPIRRRFMRWWNPAKGVVAFSSSLPFMPEAASLLARVETAFAPEIAQYGIQVRSHIRAY